MRRVIQRQKTSIKIMTVSITWENEEIQADAEQFLSGLPPPDDLLLPPPASPPKKKRYPKQKPKSNCSA